MLESVGRKEWLCKVGARWYFFNAWLSIFKISGKVITLRKYCLREINLVMVSRIALSRERQESVRLVKRSCCNLHEKIKNPGLEWYMVVEIKRTKWSQRSKRDLTVFGAKGVTNQHYRLLLFLLLSLVSEVHCKDFLFFVQRRMHIWSSVND